MSVVPRSVAPRRSPGRSRGGTLLAAAAATAIAVLTACGSPTATGGGDDGGADATEGGGQPVEVGLVYSQTGPLASYGEQYIQGFEAGLDYATDGTGAVDGRPVEVTEADDAGDPAKAVQATDLIHRHDRRLETRSTRTLHITGT